MSHSSYKESINIMGSLVSDLINLLAYFSWWCFVVMSWIIQTQRQWYYSWLRNTVTNQYWYANICMPTIFYCVQHIIRMLISNIYMIKERISPWYQTNKAKHLCMYVRTRLSPEPGAKANWQWSRAIIGTGCRVQVLCLISIAQSVCQRAFSLMAIWCLRPWAQILHSAEKDNLSPLDLNIACLCQSIEIDNTHVCLYVCMYVCMYVYHVCTYVLLATMWRVCVSLSHSKFDIANVWKPVPGCSWKKQTITTVLSGHSVCGWVGSYDYQLRIWFI